MAKLLEGKTRPTIAISINERSYSSDSIDPAAETEVGYMLKKLGFTVLDSKTSTKVADITVTGEAFSEVGLKKGDLVSARARVELKAIETKNDRQMSQLISQTAWPKKLPYSLRQQSSPKELFRHSSKKRTLSRLL